MPIYEFRCKTCKCEFEEFLPINAINPPCQECDGNTEKLISHFSGVVTGSENRTIDCIVGSDADKRRGYLEKRKEKRKLAQTGG